MNEPATVLTDYLLAALAAGLGMRLWRSGPGSSSARRLWGASFLALGVTALVGGTWHALAPDGLPSLRHQLWSITYVTLGLADLSILAGAATAALPGRFRSFAYALLAARFVAYAALLLSRRDFRHVGYEYAVTLLLLLAFGLDLLRRKERAAALVLAGVLVSFAGGLVQQQRLAPHRRFNHNDLFHVIQMAGIGLLYRGGLRLRDR